MAEYTIERGYVEQGGFYWGIQPELDEETRQAVIEDLPDEVVTNARDMVGSCLEQNPISKADHSELGVTPGVAHRYGASLGIAQTMADSLRSLGHEVMLDTTQDGLKQLNVGRSLFSH